MDAPKTTRYENYNCVELANDTLSLFVTQSVGPRVIGLHFRGGGNLFAVLPEFVVDTPNGEYHFYGGHRLWRAPEDPHFTYFPDDAPVDIQLEDHVLTAIQPVEAETGLQKLIQLTLDGATVHVKHKMSNHGNQPVELALWAITQLVKGGVGILPHTTEDTGLLPNRRIALWPYTDIRSPYIEWGNSFTTIHAALTEGALKIGASNPRGWLGYWLNGTLFVKKAKYDPAADYIDFGCSSEIYSNAQFLELETLSGVGTLSPGESFTHEETWKVFGEIPALKDESIIQKIVTQLGLE